MPEPTGEPLSSRNRRAGEMLPIPAVDTEGVGGIPTSCREIDLQIRAAYDALEAFALDKWATTNPILVPDDEKELQQAYYKACPHAPSVMKERLAGG